MRSAALSAALPPLPGCTTIGVTTATVRTARFSAAVSSSQSIDQGHAGLGVDPVELVQLGGVGVDLRGRLGLS